MTVYLCPASIEALKLAAEYEELSKTDVINRALQLYTHVVTASPGTELTVKTPTGDDLRLVMPS